MASSRAPEVNRDLKFVMDMLSLKTGKGGEITITFGAVQRNDHELAVLSRSMAEILLDLASGIGHRSSGRGYRRASHGAIGTACHR